MLGFKATYIYTLSIYLLRDPDSTHAHARSDTH